MTAGGAGSPRWRRMEPDARREQILARAVVLFGERPYAAVSTTELARDAGVARGLINHYFGTKRELYLEVVRRMVTVPDMAFDDVGGSLAERVDVVLRWFLDVLGKHGRTWLAAIGAEGVGSDAEVERIRAEADEQATDRLLAATGLADRPELRPRVRAYGGLVKAAAREWLINEAMTRDEVHRLLATTLVAILAETELPR